jgi:hypothetical protein
MGELALIPEPAPERPIAEMTDRELLEEMAQNSRDVRDSVAKALASFESSPLGQMLKGGQKMNLMTLMKGI